MTEPRLQKRKEKKKHRWEWIQLVNWRKTAIIIIIFSDYQNQTVYYSSYGMVNFEN